MKKLVIVISIVMVAVLLCLACVGCSAENYETKLEKKGYTVTYASKDGNLVEQGSLSVAKTLFGLKGEVEFVVWGVKSGSTVAYIKFTETSDAKDFVETVKSDSSEQKVRRVGGLVKVEYNSEKKK